MRTGGSAGRTITSGVAVAVAEVPEQRRRPRGGRGRDEDLHGVDAVCCAVAYYTDTDGDRRRWGLRSRPDRRIGCVGGYNDDVYSRRPTATAETSRIHATMIAPI
ncbi:hypothetical protein GCM10009060_17810 [Halorubrum trapanicum]